MRKEAQVFLSQIVISTEGKTPEQVAVAEKKAKDLVARANKGEKFSDLARDNSDDVETAKNGGQIGPMTEGHDGQSRSRTWSSRQRRALSAIRSSAPKGFVILKVEDRFEAGQASFEEVKNELQDRLTQPKMEPKVRAFLTQLREDAFLEIKEGYVDSGAAPGKDTRWKDVAAVEAADHHQGRSGRAPQEAPPVGDSRRHREGYQAAGQNDSRARAGSARTAPATATTDKAPDAAPAKTRRPGRRSREEMKSSLR